MALEASFRNLSEQLRLLRDELEQLQQTVIEKPRKGDVVLVDLFSDAVDDLSGLVEEANEAVTEGLKASAWQVLDQARRSLKTSHEKMLLTTDRLTCDLLSYDRLEELMSLGRERGGDWMMWARGVKSALESCRGPLYEVNQALFACWQELTERIGAGNVSVQATNVGQQITVPAAELAREGFP